MQTKNLELCNKVNIDRFKFDNRDNWQKYLSKLTKLSGLAAQIQSWVVAAILAGIASYLGIGIFPNVSVFAVLVYGLLIGLVSNGVFEIPITKTLLVWIKARFTPVAE